MELSITMKTERKLKGMLLLQQPINTQYMWQMLMVKQNISWLCPERVFGVRYGGIFP